MWIGQHRLIAGLYAAADARANVAGAAAGHHGAGSLLGTHHRAGHIETIDAGALRSSRMNINFGLFPPLASAPTPKSPDGTSLREKEKDGGGRSTMKRPGAGDLDRWIADSPAPHRACIFAGSEISAVRLAQAVGTSDRDRPAPGRSIACFLATVFSLPAQASCRRLFWWARWPAAETSELMSSAGTSRRPLGWSRCGPR